MKPIIRLLPILAMSLCLFACAKKERPVTPSDGTSVVTIASPEVVIEDDCIQVFYLRNGEPVQATFQEDGLLSDFICLLQIDSGCAVRGAALQQGELDAADLGACVGLNEVRERSRESAHL